MAQDITSFVVIGRITRDAEAKYTQGGTPYCRFSVASNYGRKVGDQWEEEVSYFDFTLWGKRAESLLQYLVKGQQVAVSGQLRQERWEQQGDKRSRVSFFVDNIQLLQRPGGGSGNGSGNGLGSQDYGQSGPEEFEDDIPF